MSSARSKRMIESVLRHDEIGLQKVETVTNINCSDNVCIQNQSVADSMRMEESPLPPNANIEEINQMMDWLSDSEETQYQSHCVSPTEQRPDEEFSAVTENITQHPSPNYTINHDIEDITQHPSPNCTINHLDFDCDNHFCPWFIENDNISPLQSVDTNSVYTPQANTPLSSFSEATPQASRKRKNNQRKDKGNIRRRHVAEWKDNKRKMLRNLGKEYESRDGTVRCGKSLGLTCHINCRLKCSMKISNEERISILAKQKGKPYIVEELQYTDFLNYKALLKENWVKSTTEDKVQWNKIREVFVKPEDPSKLFYKYDLAADDYHVLCIKASTRRQCISNVREDALYENILPIPKAKKDDLVSMRKSQIIPSTYHNFFQSLPESGNDLKFDSDSD